MRSTIARSIAGCLLATLLLSVGGDGIPLPQDLRTKTLLILLYDEIPHPGDIKNLIEHNEEVVRVNARILEDAKEYPFPHAFVSRSNYLKMKEVPEHDYVLNSELMEEFNVMGRISHYSSGVEMVTYDLLVVNAATQEKYVVAKQQTSKYHLRLKEAFEDIVKQLERGR